MRSVPEVHWVYAAINSDFENTNNKLIRVEEKQIALFKTANGFRACDNRCPHEGYPLSQGSTAEDRDTNRCILTCNWHNWKFDLATGDNLFGGDQLRSYPLEMRGDEIWVDITEPTHAEQRSTIEKSLYEAFSDHEYDRLAREIARLIRLGDDPLDALRLSIKWSWQHLEFGWTHAYAGMADWLILYDENSHDPELQLVCLIESVGHIAYDVLREMEYPYTEESMPYDKTRFLTAVEAEDENTVVAMIRGGLRDGLSFEDFEPALSEVALAHYNDFGHSLIYVTKAGALIHRLGDAIAEPVLIALMRSQIFAAREDKIPEFKSYAPSLTEWHSSVDKEHSEDSEDINSEHWHRLSINKALKETLNHRHNSPEALYVGWLIANAINLLSFDIAHQNKVAVSISGNVGWLSFTHAITFANAVRKQCVKFPELWPQALLQMACFSGRHVAFTTAEYELEKWSDIDFDSIIKMVLDHGQDEYIVSVHWLKLALAVREEIALLPNEQAQYLTAALNRFMHSPLKRKQTRRTAYQSMLFISKQ
jgi:nitrite reductase/ring-hydroxylating ferredoxin subunit